MSSSQGSRATEESVHEASLHVHLERWRREKDKNAGIAVLEGLRSASKGSRTSDTAFVPSSKAWKSIKPPLVESFEIAGPSAVLDLFEQVVHSKRYQMLYYVLVDSFSTTLQRSEVDLHQVSPRVIDLCAKLLKQRQDAYLAFAMRNLREMLSGHSILRLMQLFRVRLDEYRAEEAVSAMLNFLDFIVGQKGIMKKQIWGKEANAVTKELVEFVTEFKLVDFVDGPSIVRFAVQNHWYSLIFKLLWHDPTKNLARTYIDAALQQKPPNTHKAHACMKDFELEMEYPELVRAYRINALTAAAEKRKFSDALFRLDRYQDDALTKFFVEKLLEMGEDWLALRTADREEVPAEDPVRAKINMNRVAEQAKERAEMHLSLPDSMRSDLLFVWTADSALEACRILNSLGRGNVVGLDGEWKPSISRRTNRASILQLATRGKVIIIDLIWMFHGGAPPVQGGPQSELEKAISNLFRSGDIIKIGYCFNGDMKTLTQSYPQASCWKEMNALLDFGHIQFVPRSAGQWQATHVKKVFRGLKDIVFQVLGKHLSKLEQMSDWEIRPLRQEQLDYAALDSYCLTQIFDEVFGKNAFPQALFTSLHCTSTGIELKRSGNVESERHRAIAKENLQHYKRTKRAIAMRSHELGISFSNGNDGKEDAEVTMIQMSSESVPVKNCAEQLGVEVRRVLKTLAFMVKLEEHGSWEPLLVLVQGNATAKEERLKNWLRIFQDAESVVIRQATPEECRIVFDMPVGGLGPISEAHKAPLTIMDRSIADIEGEVYAGAGSLTHTTRFTNVDILERLCKPMKGVISNFMPKSQSKLETDAEGKKVKFMVDTMLGRLGKMLRIVGVDCRYVSDVDERVDNMSEEELQSLQNLGVEERLEIKKQRSERRKEQLEAVMRAAREEKRVFLTTDRRAADRYADMNILLLENGANRFALIHEVCDRFGIELRANEFLSRCVKCNGHGFEFIEKSEVRRLKEEGHFSFVAVPDGIIESVDSFYCCKQPQCKAVFWEGPKFDRCCQIYQHLYTNEVRQLRDINSPDLHE